MNAYEPAKVELVPSGFRRPDQNRNGSCEHTAKNRGANLPQFSLSATTGRVSRRFSDREIPDNTKENRVEIEKVLRVTEVIISFVWDGLVRMLQPTIVIEHIDQVMDKDMDSMKKVSV